MFKVREDGEMSASVQDKSIYIERWDKFLFNSERMFQLPNQMENKITMINVDFERDFVVSGDCKGNLMIQRISINQILFSNSQLFRGNSYRISCSSIMDDYLCVGSYNYNNNNIGTINLKTFTKVDQLTFEYDHWVSSLNICPIGDQAFLIAAGAGGKSVILQFYNCL